MQLFSQQGVSEELAGQPFCEQVQQREGAGREQVAVCTQMPRGPAQEPPLDPSGKTCMLWFDSWN